MAKKRLKKNKQRAMNRRKISCKKPMPAEQKEAQKKSSAIDRARTKTVLNKILAKILDKN